MKSLLLKDLYNISHNSKSMIFIFLFFLITILPKGNIVQYITMCSGLCSMMIITTFAFDDRSNWKRYAMIMPITKKDLVKSKFLALVIFNVIGIIIGSVLGIIGGTIFRVFDITNINDLGMLGLGVITALFTSMVLGSIVIPLLFKYGVEKARMISIVAFVVPVVIFVGIVKLFQGIQFSINVDYIIMFVIITFPVLWISAMYKISYKIFEKQEI